MTETQTKSSELLQSAKELLARNGRLVTAFSVVFILLTGFVLIEDPSKWYLPAIGVIVTFIAFFIFANARVAIKIIAAAFLLLGVSSLSYQIGLLIDPYSTGPLLWFFSFPFVFFVSLAYSYIHVQSRSRWGVMSLALIAAFVTSYITAFGTMNPHFAALSSTVMGLGVFVVFYSFTRKTNYQAKNMPINSTLPEITDDLLKDADDHDWLLRNLTQDNEGHYLVWDERAYLLYPIHMDEAFSIIGTKKKIGLGYKGKTINPWLIDTIYNNIPFWKSRKADITVVLLDLNNANGRTPRTIGVTLPDTKKVAAVGVMPSKQLLSNKPKQKSFLDRIDQEFAEYGEPLTDKQFDALNLIGIKDRDDLKGSFYKESAVEADEDDSLDIPSEDEEAAETPQNTAAQDK